MTRHPLSADHLLHHVRSPHAEVRAWALRWLAALAPERAPEAIAALPDRVGDTELEAVKELVADAYATADLVLPERLREQLRPIAGRFLRLAEAARRVRAAGDDPWSVVDGADARADANEHLRTAFVVLARRQPRRAFDRLRAHLEAGRGARLPLEVISRIASLAAAEDVPLLTGWADSAAEDATRRARWTALDGLAERAGVTNADGAYLRNGVVTQARDTATDRVLTREVLDQLVSTGDKDTSLRRRIATALLERPVGADRRFATNEAHALAVLRAVASTDVDAVVATDLVIGSGMALGRIDRARKLLDGDAPPAQLVPVACASAGEVLEALEAELGRRFAMASPSEQEAVVTALLGLMNTRVAESRTAARLVAGLKGFPLERVFDDHHARRAPDIRDELVFGLSRNLSRHADLDPSRWSKDAAIDFLVAVAGSPSAEAVSILMRHWDAFIRVAGIDELVATATEFGDERLLPKLVGDWHPGERETATAARLLARLLDAEGSLPEGLVADADAQERQLDLPGEFPLRLTCRGCHRSFWMDVHEAWFQEEGGRVVVVGGRVVTCPRCGVVDDYDVRSVDTRPLVVVPAPAGLRERRHRGLPALDDGTPITRATAGLEQARAIAIASPSLANWRQLLRIARLFRAHALVAEAATHVIELVPSDLRAATALANARAVLGDRAGAREAGGHALELFVARRASVADADRVARARDVVEALRSATTAESTIALRLTWRAAGATTPGGTLLAGIDDARADGVARLLASDSVVSARITDAVSADELAALDRRLSQREEAGSAAAPASRNGPCPCGSGAKHKKCCGR